MTTRLTTSWSLLLGLLIGCVRGLAAESPDLSSASAKRPWTNSIGMRFVALPGTKVLFATWETRRQDFAQFVKETGYNATNAVYSLTTNRWTRQGASWMSPGFSQTDRHPVCGVNWDDAKAFCAWLSKKEGKTYRLPTDLEWSQAVGLQPEIGRTPKDRSGGVPDVFPWGTTFPPMIDNNPVGNYPGAEASETDWPKEFRVIDYYRDPFPRTAPAGSFAPNALGVYDMGGNVWEWCEDETEPGSGSRVLRGASWIDNLESTLNASYRHASKPNNRNVSAGFRCVLVSDAPAAGK